jgi:hypothetical protein
MQTKEEIAREVQDELSKAFAAFGYEILQALVTDIDPDARVKAAMNEVSCLRPTWHVASCTPLSHLCQAASKPHVASRQIGL